MANKESPNTLLSTSIFRVLDMVCEGPISGFMPKPGNYGLDPLVSTYYDDVPVRNLDGSYNFNITGQGYSFDYTLGTATQTGITGFQKVESIIPLSSNTRVANPPAGAGPVKSVVASFTSNTYPDADAIKVTVRVPALFAQDNENNTNPYEIQYAVDISINNGQFVNVGGEVILGKCTSTYQKATVYQLPKSTPAAAYYEWKVRVRRVSQNILSIRTQNEIFVDSIAVVSTSLYAYPNTVLVGTQIGADQFSSIPARAYEIAGLLVSVPSGYSPTSYGYDTGSFNRQCDVAINNKLIGLTTQAPAQSVGILAGMRLTGLGIPANSIITSVAPGNVAENGDYFFSIDKDPTATTNNIPVTFYPAETDQVITPAVYPAIWLGEFVTGKWTDNPAWIFYDLMTNPVHGLGDFIESSYVDKWTLYRIAQFCDAMVDNGAGGQEPRFTCNVVIQQPQDAYSVLLNLASTFRGMLYYANGSIHASQQQDTSPVFAFNNSNVVDGVFNYSDTARNARATVAKVKWIDPQNGYRENIEYIEDVDGILRYGYQEKEITAFACTSKGQAFRLGSWTLESERLLTETVTFQTDLEGVALQPGDNFAVYDNFRNNRAQAGRITAWTPGRSSVTLDRSVAIEPNQVYSLSAIIPKAQFNGTGDITGSNQIDLIRQSQIETFAVTTSATSGTTSLVIAGSFSTGIYAGSPFVLATSGITGSVFNRASFYTCLATAEVEPGKIEILGLQANTGIQFSIQSGYTTVDWPTNQGDIRTAISPPSNLFVTGITGIDSDNTFYSSINLTWRNGPTSDLSYYVVSGREFDTAYERFTVIDTGFNFTRGDTGQYLFKVAAVSYGGVESAFITGGFLIRSDQMNPLGALRPLSGVRLTENLDPLYLSSTNRYTGYIGINPGFSWGVVVDAAGQPIVDEQFISGYRLAAKSVDGLTTYFTTDISGAENTTFLFTGNLLRNFTSTPRCWNLDVDTIDIYGNVGDGAEMRVDNPPMKPPFASGFVGFNGGVIYNVTPSLQYDTSGIYLWVNQNPSFTPTYLNYNYSSSNLAGTAAIAPNTGVFWTWFALGDTFALSGNPIWGPVSGNASAIASYTIRDITSDISGAFTFLTGMITSYGVVASGNDALIVTTVNGLSGQIMGTTLGNINTALNARIDQIVLTTGSALATQINAISARVQLTGQTISATVGTLASALATTGGALAEWITYLGAQTSGQSASVTIGARAFVTGDVNGIGGVAVANWGFKLNANNKVVSMMATSESWGAGSTEYGTIVFGEANLQSNTYTPGVAGWQISADGNVEFGTGEFRGNLAAAQSGILIGRYQNYSSSPYLIFPETTVHADGAAIVGRKYTTDVANPNLVTSRGQIYLQDVWRNGSSVKVAGLVTSLDAGEFRWGSGDYASATYDTNLYRKEGNHLATDDTLSVGAALNVAGLTTTNTLDCNSTSNFDALASFKGNLLIDNAAQKSLYFHSTSNKTYITENNGLQIFGDSSHPVTIRDAFLQVPGRLGFNGGIRYDGGTGYAIAFIWDGSNVKVIVDGTAQGTIPNP